MAGRACAVAETFCGTARSQGEAADVSAVCGGIDRAGRSQECRPDGRAGRAGRLRPAAPFRVGRVWDEAPLQRALAIQADKLVCGADAFLVIDYTALPKKVDAFGRGRASICVGLGQDGELPDLCQAPG